MISPYFPEHKLPDNVIATTDAKVALLGADYCLHAFSSSFLEGIADYVDPGLPFISLSKGLELNTQRMMSQIIPRAMKNPPAGIVDGMDLGNNSMTALVAQGCSEIRWLATKEPGTSCNLSRNRTVGVRLGSGEKLDDILSLMNQVAEGVSTAGAVVALAKKYNVKMPVLAAVA
ncbi:hypothetical protein Dsin_002333 [Dipteronia sinensis]|uniref:Glycerol-3-phosphate dehydrogenase NAD-dependent N-terminal domain-containing protein n=1 Tax=Dipteronia sinensis TaxID=43782 RepID=A0AAE0EJV8_9ROSI|nr:hypothetical protein Dsin_002333 [Dipteronia sinensis]